MSSSAGDASGDINNDDLTFVSDGITVPAASNWNANEIAYTVMMFGIDAGQATRQFGTPLESA